MDERRAWLGARRKRRLRILAVILCFCVLFTIYPDLLETIPVFAAVKSEQSDVTYISDFEALPEEGENGTEDFYGIITMDCSTRAGNPTSRPPANLPENPNPPAADGTDSGQTTGAVSVQQEEVKIGKGTVLVTVVCEEEKCTAAVADAGAVVKAALTPGQQEIVNSGKTIEIRIDVTDISEKVPSQDKEVIERGIEAYREEAPGLVPGMYVDISMFMKIGEGDWNVVAATDEPIEVVIGIPEKLQSRGRKFYIICAHDGEYIVMNDLDDEPDAITICTDLFSSCAIAYVETEEAEADAKCGVCHICPTFLGVCYFIWLAVILAVMLIVIRVVWRRRKEEEPGERKG